MCYLQTFACAFVTILAAETTAVAASAPKLRIAYSSISGNTLPLWLALDQGLFKKQGLDVEPVYVAGEPMMTQSIIGGDIAAAQQGAVGAIRGNAGGLDVVVFLEPISKFNYSLVTRQDIQKVEDFKGKKWELEEALADRQLLLPVGFSAVSGCNLIETWR